MPMRCNNSSTFTFYFLNVLGKSVKYKLKNRGEGIKSFGLIEFLEAPQLLPLD